MPIVSPDHHLMTPEGVYHWTQDRVLWAWHRAEDDFGTHLKDPAIRRVVLMVGLPGSGKTTYLNRHGKDPATLFFDATFVNAKSRRKYVEQATAAGRVVDAVYFDTPLETCLERNAARPPDRQVPMEAMERMSRRLTVPTRLEGFNRVIRVRAP